MLCRTSSILGEPFACTSLYIGSAVLARRCSRPLMLTSSRVSTRSGRCLSSGIRLCNEGKVAPPTVPHPRRHTCIADGQHSSFRGSAEVGYHWHMNKLSLDGSYTICRDVDGHGSYPVPLYFYSSVDSTCVEGQDVQCSRPIRKSYQLGWILC